MLIIIATLLTALCLAAALIGIIVIAGELAIAKVERDWDAALYRTEKHRDEAMRKGARQTNGKIV